MPRLNYLNVAWNQLENVNDEISVLHEHAANLITLDLRHNPWKKVSVVILSLYCSVCSTLIFLTSCEQSLCSNGVNINGI